MRLQELIDTIESVKAGWRLEADRDGRAAAELRARADAQERLARDAALLAGIPPDAVAVGWVRAPLDREAERHEASAALKRTRASAKEGMLPLRDPDELRDADYMGQHQHIIGPALRAHLTTSEVGP
jgi:hypothetical protein